MKLNIGGMEKKEGWKIMNIQTGGEAGYSPNKSEIDFIGDITDLSQFDDNSIEEIYTSHIIEHVPQKQVADTFKGIYRVLKDNGKFYVSVPDMEILCRIFMAKEAPKQAKFHAMRMMFGGQIDQHDYHYFGWNYDFLKDYLEEAGFQKVEKVKSFSLFNDTSDYAPYNNVPISLNVIAHK